MTDVYNEASVIAIFRGTFFYNSVYNSNPNSVSNPIYSSIYNLFCFSFSTNSSMRWALVGC